MQFEEFGYMYKKPQNITITKLIDISITSKSFLVCLCCCWLFVVLILLCVCGGGGDGGGRRRIVNIKSLFS